VWDYVIRGKEEADMGEPLNQKCGGAEVLGWGEIIKKKMVKEKEQGKTRPGNALREGQTLTTRGNLLI